LLHLNFPPGLNWVVVTWLLSSSIGLAAAVSNLRGSIRGVFASRGFSRAERAMARGSLAIHVPSVLWLALMLAAGVFMVVVAFRTGMQLEFSNKASEFFVAAVAAAAVIGPALHAVLTRATRRRTLRELDDDNLPSQ
jgi:hypothetical protein